MLLFVSYYCTCTAMKMFKIFFSFLFSSQLQSLVARIQCGDLVPVLTSLLKDRDEKGVGQGAGLTHRSLYRETLFLQCILLDNDIGECVVS